MSRSTPLLIALALVFTACTDDGEPTDTSPDSTGTETSTGDGDGDMTGDGDGDPATGDGDGDMAIDCMTDAWDINADTEWKSAWMAACMIPAVTPVLQGLDPVKFETITCANCHGEDLGGGTFAMPATVTINFAEADMWPDGYYDPMTMMGAMADLVVTSADALGYVPGPDPDQFGCGGCHVIE